MLTGFYNLQDISRSHRCPSITISYHLSIAGGGNLHDDDDITPDANGDEDVE